MRPDTDLPASLTPARRPAHRLAQGLALVAATVLLAACGGGDDDTGAGAADNAGGGGAAAASVDLPCNTALFVAGAVDKPTAAQLKSYAGTYEGSEGKFGPNPGDAFVKSGSATLIVNNDGTVRYKNTDYKPVSVCIDKTAGGLGTILYVHTDKAHLDISDKVDASLGQAWGISLADGSTLFQGGLKK